jgi:homoserine kinase
VTLPVRVRAPATTANLGPGFDCAGAALDLWNELEVFEADGVEVEVEGEGAGEIGLGPDHLGLRAFALLAPIDGKRFVFRNRIPLARGLGSSAATIALGLVAASFSLGRWPEVETMLERALELEQHADNLAAALAGGACLTWNADGKQRVARLAPELPLVAVAVVPSARVETAAARAALPDAVSHADATFTVARAALLGAGLVARSPELLSQAFADRLHEPYRGPSSVVYDPIRESPPAGAEGVTISGSGPTVIVWAKPGAAASCAAELERRFPSERVLVLPVVSTGAGPVADALAG